MVTQFVLIKNSFQVGNCVGKRNYRFFYMFIVSLAFLAVFIFSCAMTHIILRKSQYTLSSFTTFYVLEHPLTIFIVMNATSILLDLAFCLLMTFFIVDSFPVTKENEPVIVVIRDTPSSVIVATICFFSVWSVIGLAGFHTYLTSSDQTTNEDVSPFISPYKLPSISLIPDKRFIFIKKWSTGSKSVLTWQYLS